MKTLFNPIQILTLLLFAACSSEDDPVPAPQPRPGDALELSVVATDFVTHGASGTRATDSGKETAFEDGDRVGIIILDGSNNLLSDNVPYKYTNGAWAFDSNNGESKTLCYYDNRAATYIVYYPYHTAADGCKSESELKTKFRPETDQSTADGYRASDLMTWSNGSSTPSAGKLTAELKHAYASVSLSPTVIYQLEDGENTLCSLPVAKIADINLTIGENIYLPHQAPDGSLRCILPAGFTSGDIRCFYTIYTKTYQHTLSIPDAVVPNTRYTSAPELINEIYSLDKAKVGDFYCSKQNVDGSSSGYLIPGDIDSLTEKQKNACLGIVMKVGKDSEGDWKDTGNYTRKDGTTPMNIIHGYVLALHDGNGGNLCRWGPNNTPMGTDQRSKTTLFCGYANTQIIKKYATDNSQDLSSAFPAVYHASEGYEKQHASPDNSSGWFLPSIGQYWYWYLKKEMIWSYMQKAGGDKWFTYYLSSSESYFVEMTIWTISFHSGSITWSHKYGDPLENIRSCLAF